jgi:hypothetical protein
MLNLNVWQPIQIYLIHTNDSGIGNNTVGLTIHTALRNCSIFAPTTVLMLTLPIQCLKYWLQLTVCTWLFLITVLESSGRHQKAYFFFFRFHLKTKVLIGMELLCQLVSEHKRQVRTMQVRYICMYVCITYFWDADVKCQLIALGNGIPMTVWCRTCESIHGVVSCTEAPGQVFVRHHTSTKWIPCALSIALCQWLIYMLPDRIALLEHTMEGCYEVQRAKFVLLQNETWRTHYKINCNDCMVSFYIIGVYTVVLFNFISLLLWICHHKLSKEMW